MDAIEDGGDRRKSREHFVALETGLVRGVTFGIEGFGLSHATGHPEQNDRVRFWGDLLRRGQKTGFIARKSGQCCGLEPMTAIYHMN